NGSPEYALTWKRWDMLSGPPICALQASARRISDKDCTGWPTARANDGTGAQECKGRTGGMSLKQAAKLAGWPTPMANKLTPQTRKDFTPNLAAVANLISGPTQLSSHAETEKPAGLVLNPHFSRWLMGYRAE